MWRKFLQWVMDNRPTRVILNQEDGRKDGVCSSTGTPLFFRAFLGEVGPWRLYLHHYKRSDPDTGVHDHPAWNVAMVLAGGYIEQRFVGLSQDGIMFKYKRVRPGMINVVDHHCFHRLIVPTDVRTGTQQTSWSLFLVNYQKAKGKRWGFLREGTDLADGIMVEYNLSSPPNSHPWWEEAPKGRCFDRDTGQPRETAIPGTD